MIQDVNKIIRQGAINNFNSLTEFDAALSGKPGNVQDGVRPGLRLRPSFDMRVQGKFSPSNAHAGKSETWHVLATAPNGNITGGSGTYYPRPEPVSNPKSSTVGLEAGFNFPIAKNAAVVAGLDIDFSSANFANVKTISSQGAFVRADLYDALGKETSKVTLKLSANNRFFEVGPVYDGNPAGYGFSHSYQQTGIESELSYPVVQKTTPNNKYLDFNVVLGGGMFSTVSSPYTGKSYASAVGQPHPSGPTSNDETVQAIHSGQRYIKGGLGLTVYENNKKSGMHQSLEWQLGVRRDFGGENIVNRDVAIYSYPNKTKIGNENYSIQSQATAGLSVFTSLKLNFGL